MQECAVRTSNVTQNAHPLKIAFEVKVPAR